MPGAFYKNSASSGKTQESRPRREAEAPRRPQPRPQVADERPRAEKGPAAAHPRQRFAWRANLTPSALVMLTMLLLLLLSCFFLFGLIIGRGMVPPSSPAELGRLLAPQAETTAEAPSTAPDAILQEEDLRFMDTLRGTTTRQAPAHPQPPAARQSAPAATPQVAPQAAAPQSSPNVTQAAPPPVAQNAPAEGSRYDFVLRVAAFKNEEQADDLRLKLEDAGMRTKLVREKRQNTNWYHVQVLYRGSAEEFQALRDDLPRFGLRDAILASKTPVP